MKRLGLILALALAVTAANAQSIVQDNLSGSEAWRAGQGPGGPSTGYLTSNLVRGGTQAITATVAGNVTMPKALAFGGNWILTGQPSAATITLPANPVPDGAVVGVCNGTTSNFATNTVTLAANSGQTLTQTVTLTTLAAGTCARVQFVRATTTWYRVQ
jgi:hypothetical protein